MKLVNIIIPTYNNLDYFLNCITSVAKFTIAPYRFKIVNNGADELKNYVEIVNDKNVERLDLAKSEILSPGRNLGWAGGINYARDYIDAQCDYILLMNDDVEILPAHFSWLFRLATVLDNDSEVGAVGPSSNIVMGPQNIAIKNIPLRLVVKYLIGFCVLIRRNVFDLINWMDESLPGGDDLDWSIRIRKNGFKLVARRDVFVLHHAFKTGIAVYGDYWNSPEMIEKTNTALIQKHGFKEFINTVRNVPQPYDVLVQEYGKENIFRRIIRGKGIDVGCGANKISPETIGVDIKGRGEKYILGNGAELLSDADIRSSGDDLHMFQDGELDYIVARHSFEHFANPLKLLREWNRVLKVGGMVGISQPDGSVVTNIPLDATHMHQWDRETTKDLFELMGFVVEEMGGCANECDFYLLARKL